jgi:hypothetical protein
VVDDIALKVIDRANNIRKLCDQRQLPHDF